MKKHPVVLSSNRPNRYGFRIATEGIDLTLMESNPVVLFNHLRPSKENPAVLPIAKLMDISIDEGGRLIGNLAFDQNDEFAKKVEQKWEDGFLNAVSVKGEIKEVSDDPLQYMEGQTMPTVTKLLLEELSIVDIPGDGGATAIRLHHEGSEEIVISLNHDSKPDLTRIFPQSKPKVNMKLIQLALGGQSIVSLAKDADEEAVARAIAELVNKAQEAVQLRADLDAEKGVVTQLNEKIKNIELAAANDKAEALVNAAFDGKKITAAEKPSFIELAKTNYDAVKGILDAKKGATAATIAEALAGGAGEGTDYASLSYREIEKKGLAAKLKAENIELFKAKFKEFYGVDYKG